MKFFVFALLACSLGVSARAATPAFEFFQPLEPLRSFAVMVHGGLPNVAPADTRRAVELCTQDGLDWLEVDVRRTQDGHHVLFRDATVNACSNGSGAVKDLTLAELKQLDAGSWFAKRFAGTRILTLEEALKLAKGKINLCLDCREVEPDLLVAEIKRSGIEKQVLVCGDESTLRGVRAGGQGAIAIMLRDVPEDAFDAGGHPSDGFGQRLDELRPAVLSLTSGQISAEVCRTLHERGIKVLADVEGSDDNGPAWDQALSAGSDIVLTRVPDELIAHLLDQSLRPRPVKFACHRGASRYAPENTLPAFEKANRLHADFVEFDVRPSHGGKYFLLHDSQLDRTTSGHGPIRDMASSAVERLDAGSWFGRPFAGLHVPSLDEFLSAVPEGMSLYFDAKDIPPEALAAALEKHQLTERTIVYQGAGYLAKLKAIDSRIRVMPGVGSAASVDVLADTLKPFAVDSRWQILSKAYIDDCHALGIQVFSDVPSNVNIDGYRQAIEWGIDLIQTDYPMLRVAGNGAGSGRAGETLAPANASRRAGMKPRLLIIGATGFVGSRWALAAERDYDVWRAARHPGDAPRSLAVDITDPASVQSAFTQARPQFVTLLSAMSDIDRAERERELAEQINHQGAVHVAQECARVGARLLFTSTDAVFDGTRGIYRETDPPTPPNWYGQTKALAERDIAGLLPTALIVRLSLVLGYSALGGGNSYLEKVTGNLRAGNNIVSPTYEFRNPIDVATLCDYLGELTARDDVTGIVHIGASDKMSRYELARAIAVRLGADASLVVAQDTPVPGRAPRGRDDFLATDRLCEVCRTTVPTCQQVIERAIDAVA